MCTYVEGWDRGREEAAWCTVAACALFVAPELDSLEHGMCWQYSETTPTNRYGRAREGFGRAYALLGPAVNMPLDGPLRITWVENAGVILNT